MQILEKLSDKNDNIWLTFYVAISFIICIEQKKVSCTLSFHLWTKIQWIYGNSYFLEILLIIYIYIYIYISHSNYILKELKLRNRNHCMPLGTQIFLIPPCFFLSHSFVKKIKYRHACILCGEICSCVVNGYETCR